MAASSLCLPSSPLRVAVVGCGRVSRSAHYEAIAGSERLELAAVCDIDRQRADEWGRRNNVPAYYDLETLLDGERLDLVSICVPNGLHPRLAARVAQRGIAVLSEKPLGTRLDEVDDLIDLCEAQGAPLFTVLQNRFNPTNQLLRRAVDKGRFGRLHTCSVSMRWHRSPAYYAEDRGWRGRRDLAGGAFTNQAVHYLDTMLWLVGAPPETVYARMGTGRAVEVETHGSAVIAFRNGVIGTVDVTCLAWPSDREGSITLMGETGTVKLGGQAMNRILEWDFAVPDPEDDARATRADYEPPTVYGFGHRDVYERLGRLLSGETDVDVPDGREGRKSVALLEGLYRSDRLGEVVRFPLGRR